MAAYVILTALDGTTVQVNPETVTSLTPVAAATLPAGIPAGTLVRSADSPDVSVQGTVAATSATLTASGGSLAILGAGFMDGATGAVTMQGGQAFTGARTAAGIYVLTKTVGVWPANTYTLLTPVAASDVTQNGAVAGAVANILTFNPAGAAADASAFVSFVVPN